jgi:hypothetical protein
MNKEKIQKVIDAMKELVSIVEIHSEHTSNNFAWAELEEAHKALSIMQEEIDKPLPEPVGFIYEDNNEITDGIMFSEDDPSTRRIKGFFEPVNIRKVYTEQPSRKPLVKQAVINAIKNISFNEMTAFNIARAIEAAHGIKEQE